MPNKIGVAQIVAVIVSVIAVIISIIALNNDTYKSAYKDGFNACIEENNLYERYETYGK